MAASECDTRHSSIILQLNTSLYHGTEGRDLQGREDRGGGDGRRIGIGQCLDTATRRTFEQIRKRSGLIHSGQGQEAVQVATWISIVALGK